MTDIIVKLLMNTRAKKMGHRGITVKAAAEVLGVSPATLRNWDKKGKLHARRDAHNGYRYYDIGELERFATAHGMNKAALHRIKLTLL